MQRITTICLSVCALCLFCSGLQAQTTRYIDEIFQVGAPTEGVMYAANKSFALGFALDTLVADIYEPTNEDSDELRPVVVLWPTGNFLPAYLNQGAYGTLKDSANVTIMRRLAARGFVGIHAEYRFGWLPGATDQATRTGTLLKAAYRGGQDAHSMARWLRKTVVVDGNPYQIDTSRIIFWGLGTGGYVSMTHAFLDREAEILANEQFYDDDGNPLVNETVDSNPKGTTETMFNAVNHPGYASTVAMSINTGGAIGDPAWIEGSDNEPITIGHHSYTDPFAPFYIGTVIVPTTMQPVVSDVGGTNRIVELANAFGLNDAIADANAVPLPSIFDPLSTAVNAVNNAYKPLIVDATPLIQVDNVTTNLSRDNMFPHVYTERLINQGLPLSGPYNWFDNGTLQFILSVVEQMFPGVPPTFNELVMNEALTNPNYNDPDEARLTIDTMLAHFIPRAYIGLNLDQIVSSTEELISAQSIGLMVAPNPASESFVVSINDNVTIIDAVIHDLLGREISRFQNVNQPSFRIMRASIPSGQYYLTVRVKDGITTTKVILN